MTRKFGHTRGGFTLMEVLVTILIIFMLMGLLLVGITHVRKLVKGTRDLAAVKSLKQGVDLFRSKTGFLPPLVKDMTPLVTSRPSIYSISVAADARALRGDNGGNVDLIGFSLYSIPYYLIGGLDAPGPNPSGLPIDGVAGPGFLAPKRDGTFEKSGERFQPFFDIGKDGKSLFTADVAAGRVVLRDANEVAFRYYRWLRGDPATAGFPVVNIPDDLNVPAMIGDPTADPELRSADYAIVGAGPNGVFGDEADLRQLQPWHPQVMPWDQLAAKVGISGDVLNDPVLQAKVRAAAMKDNVIAVGVDK